MANGNGATAQVTGRDLKLLRVQAGYGQADIATRLSVSRRRVSALESALRPTPAAVRRYLAAMAELSTR